MSSENGASHPFALVSEAGQRVVVATALVQALLLLVFHEGVVREWAIFEGIAVRAVYLTAVAAGPLTLYFLLHDPRRRYAWASAGGVMALLVPLALYVGQQCAPDLGVEIQPILVPFGVSLFVGWFAALAYLQAGRVGRWFDYDLLFASIWQNTLGLALALLFTGAVWVLLLLCMELFNVIGISFVEEMFTDRRFVYPATGLVAGVGIVLVRSYEGATEAVRGVLLALVRALLPLGAAITLIFLAALGFTGLQPLWDTGHAALLMMAFASAMILLLNGVFEDGPDQPPYPRIVRRPVEAAFVVLPAYPILSAIALGLRVGQYGWTLQRFWAALIIGVIVIVGLAYAIAVVAYWISFTEKWLRLIRPVNVAVGLLLAVLALLVNSPLIDPTRVVVADQVDRITGTSASAAEMEDDLEYLRFRTGMRGYRALQRMQEEAVLADRPPLAEMLDSVLARENPIARPEHVSADRAEEIIPVVGDSALRAPSALYPEIARTPMVLSCREWADCVLLSVQLREGGAEEWVLFVRGEARLDGYVWAADPTGRWSRKAVLETVEGARAESAWAAIRRGEVQTVSSRWRDLEVGGLRLDRR